MEKILILLNLVVALGGAGAVFYAHNMIKPAPTDQSAEVKELKDEALAQSQIQAVPIKKFMVNLYSSQMRLRYLDLEMSVLTFEEKQKELITANEHIFKDVVIEIASHLEPEELDNVTGKILLENKIKKQVNAKLSALSDGQPVVKQIFFSGFVVQ